MMIVVDWYHCVKFSYPNENWCMSIFCFIESALKLFGGNNPASFSIILRAVLSKNDWFQLTLECIMK